MPPLPTDSRLANDGSAAETAALEQRYSVRVQGDRVTVGEASRQIPYSPLKFPPSILPGDDVVDYVATDPDAERVLMPSSITGLAQMTRLGFGVMALAVFAHPLVLVAWSQWPAAVMFSRTGKALYTFEALGPDLTLVYFMGLAALTAWGASALIAFFALGALDFYLANAQETRFREAATRFNANLRARITRASGPPVAAPAPVEKKVIPPPPPTPARHKEEVIQPAQPDEDDGDVKVDHQPGNAPAY